METMPLTIELPKAEAMFLKEYAKTASFRHFGINRSLY